MRPACPAGRYRNTTSDAAGSSGGQRQRRQGAHLQAGRRHHRKTTLTFPWSARALDRQGAGAQRSMVEARVARPTRLAGGEWELFWRAKMRARKEDSMQSVSGSGSGAPPCPRRCRCRHHRQQHVILCCRNSRHNPHSLSHWFFFFFLSDLAGLALLCIQTSNARNRTSFCLDACCRHLVRHRQQLASVQPPSLKNGHASNTAAHSLVAA